MLQFIALAGIAVLATACARGTTKEDLLPIPPSPPEKPEPDCDLDELEITSNQFCKDQQDLSEIYVGKCETGGIKHPYFQATDENLRQALFLAEKTGGATIHVCPKEDGVAYSVNLGLNTYLLNGNGVEITGVTIPDPKNPARVLRPVLHQKNGDFPLFYFRNTDKGNPVDLDNSAVPVLLNNLVLQGNEDPAATPALGTAIKVEGHPITLEKVEMNGFKMTPGGVAPIHAFNSKMEVYDSSFHDNEGIFRLTNTPFAGDGLNIYDNYAPYYISTAFFIQDSAVDLKHSRFRGNTCDPWYGSLVFLFGGDKASFEKPTATFKAENTEFNDNECPSDIRVQTAYPGEEGNVTHTEFYDASQITGTVLCKNHVIPGESQACEGPGLAPTNP